MYKDEVIKGESPKVSDLIRDEIKNSKNDDKDLASHISNFIANEFKEVTDSYKELKNNVINLSTGPIEQIKQLLFNNNDSFKNLIENFLKSYEDKISAFVSEEFKGVIEKYQTLKTSIISVLTTPLNYLNQTVLKFRDNMTEGLNSFLEKFFGKDAETVSDDKSPITIQNKKNKDDNSSSNLPVNLIMNISTLDTDSFNKSKNQLISEAMSYLCRTMTRNF